MEPVSQDAFEEMINDALDTIPEEFARHMTNMVVLARDFNPDEPTLLGLFEGIPLTEQHSNHSGFLPDAVFVYKDALEAMCSDEEELRHEVKVTVLHEVGHYFGLEEHELHELGWG
ncbi:MULTISPECIES: metallopeptidase family protein [Corynebacterium]|uniref:Metallopeptidase family protein n=1 Tax=Corynebacterium pseudogenitalium TaxID=38303 RepID=A0ABD4TSD5_9CORY|nr:MULTISPECIES: metallopeptidase family protein [Corynebacterium]MCQ4614251.1 metallopeptidase family protein [Corynebacterium pseudogenitalium]MDK8244773.1 metallopeptidase family protein [Corynebacterium sp. UMB10321]MDK8364131.1 metallopeptidase family protein [Corynebacterium sp. UMB10119B]